MMHHNGAGELCVLATNIQKYTIHDGPGIRTEVFFKGCPLHCLWCSNPETIDPRPELAVYPKKCLGPEKCNYCVKACPLGKGTPIHFDDEGGILPVIMLSDCKDCYKCADACPGGGLTVWGKQYSVSELLKIVNEDRSFYNRTGGGVTISGGDVMMQWEFATQFLKACKEIGLNVCVESEVCCPTEHMESVIEYADLLIMDIKHINSEKHKNMTGAGNELILKNIIRAGELGKRIVIRTPVVIGYNADEDNIRGIAAFIQEHLSGSIVQYQLLPYRKMGTEKYDTLGQKYPMGEFKPPERSEWEQHLIHLRDMVSDEYGIPVSAGSSDKLPL